MIQRLGFVCLFVCLAAAAASADCIELNFDQDGVLPSAQGFTFNSTLPEASIYSVSGGLLHLDSLGTLQYAWYEMPGAYDPSRDFELTVRMKVVSVTGPFGLDFEVSDGTTDYEFGFVENGVYLPPPPNSRPFLALPPTTDDFHTYRIVGSSGSATYQLYIDNVLYFSGGPVSGGDPIDRFFFGDGTYDADAKADFDFIRLCQPDAVMTVAIDLKPGDPTNAVNSRSRGNTPIAILGSAALPVASIDVATVHAGAAPATKPSFEDVNGDGYLDLVLHFDTILLGLDRSSTEVVVEGQTVGGQAIRGTDSVRVVR